MEKLKKNTQEYLSNLGVDKKYKGYRYWSTAVEYMILNFYEKNLEEIYKEVARRYKTSRERVAKAMQYITKKVDFEKYFNINGKVTNSMFLILLCREIKK